MLNRTSLPYPPTAPFTPAFAARFWQKVAIGASGDCWPWQASRGGPGYGHCWAEFDGEYRCVDAHRLAYLLACGPVPEGLMVLHRCNCKRCCNPIHLEIGTAADNARQALHDGLTVRTLRPADVLAVIKERHAGRLVVEIAARRGVRAKHVRRILSGEQWAHLTGISARIAAPGGEQLDFLMDIGAAGAAWSVAESRNNTASVAELEQMTLNFGGGR